MRLAMIIQSYYPRVGGAENQVAGVSRILGERGVEVHVVTRRYPGMAPFEVMEGVPVHRMPAFGPKLVASLSYTLAALATLRGLKPDVIHAHELFSPTTTGLAAKLLWRTPVLVTAHLSGPDGEVGILRRAPLGPARLRAFRDHVDAFAAISREIVTELVDCGVDEARCHLIPNGVDADRYKPAAPGEKDELRARLRLPARPLAVFTGRLVHAKRVDRLIKIWPQVRAHVSGACLVIVGDGSHKGRLQHDAGAGVSFVGRQENVIPFLQAADLFVMSSDTEGLPVAVLEAMSAGLPPVVTAVGGNPDVIEHGINGWLVAPEDEDGLARGIIKLLTDVGTREMMGRQARLRVEEAFSLQTAASRLLELYVKLVAAPRRWTYS